LAALGANEMIASKLIDSEIGIARGNMSGRDVLIETALIQVSLAFAATLIGLAWVTFG